MSSSRRYSAGLLLWALSVLLAAGCSGNHQKHIASGKSYLAQGKYNEALIEFRNAVKANPNVSETHYNLAIGQLNAGQFGDAYQSLIKTVQLNSNNTDAQLYLADLLLLESKFDEARLKADLVLKRNPGNLKALIILGNSYSQMIQLDDSAGEIKRGLQREPRFLPSYKDLADRKDARREEKLAEESYAKAAAANPSSVLPKIALANFYMILNRPVESEKLLQEALAQDAKSADVNNAQGFFFLQNQRLAEAEAAYTRVRDAVPNDPLPKIVLADFLMGTGQTDRAMDAYRNLAAESSTNILGRARLANAYLSRGEFDKAGSIIDEILKIDPKDADGQVLHGQLLLMQKKVPEAMQALQTALKTRQTSAQAHYFMGLAQISSGDVQKGESELKTALILDPSLTQAYLALARLKMNSGDFQNAASLARQALDLSPNLDDARLILAGALIKTKDYQNARAELESFVGKNPSNEVGHLRLGEVYRAQGNVQQAEKEMESSLKINPHYADALDSLSDLYLAQGSPQKALDRINRAIEQNPQQAKLYEILGRTYGKMKNYAKAEEAFLKAVSIDPNNATYRQRLGEFYAVIGKNDKSIETLEKLARENPANIGFKFGLANAYFDQKSYGNVDAIANEILKANPKNPEGLLLKGRTLLAQNNAAAAVAPLKQALDVSRDSAEAQYLLGLAYFQLGNRSGAEKAWSDAAQSQNRSAAPAIALAKLKLESKNADEAIRYAQQAKTIDPGNKEAQLIQGSANLLKKDYGTATTDLESYVHACPDDAVGQQRLGTAYLNMGNFARAESQFEAALKIDPASREALVGIANLCMHQKRPEKAIQRINQQLTRLSGPARGGAFTLLAELYFQQKDAVRAEDALKKAIEADLKNPAYRTALAAFYESSGNPGKSAEVMQNLAKEQPGNVSIKKQLAALYTQQKSWEKGIQVIDEVLKLNAKDSEAHVLKSRLLIGQGKVDDAISEARNAVNANPKSNAARYALGQAYYSKDPKSPNAESAWTEAINSDQHNLAAYLALSQLKLNAGDYPSAIRYAQQALRVEQNADAHLLMGKAYSGQGDGKNAAEQYREYLKIKPDDVEVRALANALLSGDSPAKELQAINREIARSPDQPKLYEMQGQVYARQKDFAKAEQSFRKALSLDANDFDAHNLLGMLYTFQNLNDKAIREFENALKINPKSSQTWYKMGLIYQQQSNPQKAIQNYREALKIDPLHVEAANNLAWLIGETGGNLGEALSLARAANQKAPDDLNVTDTLGWLYYRNKAYRSAVDALKECVAKDPKNPVFRYHLGMSYFQLADKANAKASLVKALELSQKFSGSEEARAILAKL